MTGIQWADKVWNPVTGCTKVSDGCKNCYAERLASSVFAGQTVSDPIGNPFVGVPRPRRFTDVIAHEDRLDEPLRWRKPKRIFVNSMSDLFHEDVPDEFIDRVFAVMALASQHTFQVLTKRPERLRSWAQARASSWHDPDVMRPWAGSSEFPLGNVRLGVSVEDQATADERIPILLDTPAAVRFVSAEPLLGKIDLRNIMREGAGRMDGLPAALRTNALTGFHATSAYSGSDGGPSLSWVICGGEAGPKARPCDVEWIRSIVQQCQSADVPVFVKQLGAKPRDAATSWREWTEVGARISAKPDLPSAQQPVILSSRAGDDPSEWPKNLRVQQLPSSPAAEQLG